MRREFALAIAVVMAVALGGCGAGAGGRSGDSAGAGDLRPYVPGEVSGEALAPDGPGAGSESATPAGAEVEWVPTMVLPVEGYLLQGEELRTVERAVYMLVEECLADQGFAVEFPEPADPIDKYSQTYRRYAYVSDRSIAERYGYHDPGTEGVVADDPEMSQEAYDALMGGDSEQEGCYWRVREDTISEGLEYLHTAGLDEPEEVQRINFDVFASSREDPRVRKAQNEWSSCMAEAGYTLRDTKDERLIEEYLPGFGASGPSQGEIDMALWDIGCQERSGVVQTWFEVESEMEQAEIDKSPEVFAAIAAEKEMVLRRVADALQGNSG